MRKSSFTGIQGIPYILNYYRSNYKFLIIYIIIALIVSFLVYNSFGWIWSVILLVINIFFIIIFPYSEKYCDDLKNIYVSREFFILKIFRLLIRFFVPFSIIYILSFITEVIYFGKSFLVYRKKKFYFQNIQDTFVVASFVVLFLILFFNHNFCCVLTFIIWWRFAGILVVNSSIIFLSKRYYIETKNLFRSILLWLINFIEITMIYAILYFSKNVLSFNDTVNRCNNQLIRPLDALYFSVSTISTTGFGDIIVKTELGKKLVLTEIIVGIFMLIIFFGILISRWKDKDDQNFLILRKIYKLQKKTKTSIR